MAKNTAELGKLWLPENRSSKSGRLIQLAFVRLRSTAEHPSAPIVFLAGGPGIPGIGLGQVPVFYSLFDRLREVSDVILLDQRGIGMSSPNLECPPASLPADALKNIAKFRQAYSESVRACVDHWRAEGVDLAAYNANSSADDLADLASALRAERLSLLGWSYGTELALVSIRRHGDRIDRVVLAGTEGPEMLLWLPSAWDLQVKKLSALAAQDRTINGIVPDMESLMRRVMARVGREPLTITITDKKSNRQVNLRIGKIGLETLIRGDLSNARRFVGLPALLYTVDQGDYSILTSHANDPKPTLTKMVKLIKVPIQAHYGTADVSTPLADVKNFEDALRANHTPIETFFYEGAKHAFCDYERPNYDPEACKLAMGRSVEFLKARLNRRM